MDAHLDPSGADTLRAAALALLVHLAFFALLALGVRWQKQEPEPVMAELWSTLPAAPRVPPAPPQPAALARPQPPVSPKPEEQPLPKAQPPKPEIVMKAKPETNKTETPRTEPPKPTPKATATPQPGPTEAAPDHEAALQRQLAMIQQQQAQAEAARAAAESERVLGDYRARIIRKIQGFLNRQPCGEGDPLVEFDVALLPTGQLRGNPVLRRSSGIPACDRAVEYAIVQADPLPVPPNPEQFRLMRELHLKICPNNPNPQCTRP